MRETRNLEFKQSVTKSFLTTVSAFANYGTGLILFGVDDAGETVGLKDPLADALKIENMINDSLDPVPHYSLEVNEDAKTICLKVYEGKAKPFLYAKRAYRRNDSATIEVDRIELSRLVLSGQNLTFDELPSSWNDFSFQMLSDRFISHLGLTKLDDNSLRTLGLISVDGGYTKAAEILSDRNGLPGVDIVRFGSNISEFFDRKTVVGESALKQYDEALEMYERYCTYEAVTGATRKTIERVPREAFREAVANALVHRTWDVAANVTIGIHDDRIVISSSGGLPEGVSEDEYLGGGISVPRNPILANIFFRLDYIEQFGTGIARINEAYENIEPKPCFEVRENSLVVTLPFAAVEVAGLNPDESLVLQELSRTRLFSRGEIEQKTGFSKDKLVRILNNLAARGLVAKEGNGRSRMYRRA